MQRMRRAYVSAGSRRAKWPTAQLPPPGSIGAAPCTALLGTALPSAPYGQNQPLSPSVARCPPTLLVPCLRNAASDCVQAPRVISGGAVADNHIMLRFLKETWFATAVFAALSRLNADRACGWIVFLGPTATALLVVPPIWGWFVVRHGRPHIGRAAFSGATIFFLIITLAMVINSAVWEVHPPRYSDAFGEGLGNILFLFYILVSGLVGGPLGAGVGALVAFVQTRCWHHPAPESGTPDSMLDGAIGGAMVATLAAPFAVLMVMSVLPKPLMPMQRWGAPSLALLLATTWLVLVPAGALLGTMAVRRWRRIAAT